MAFWGTEVKPGRPETHKFDQVRGRLHISQAALGIGSASNKCVVQCNIGDKSPVILCVLLPDKTESCHLDLEFEESDDVVFSVIGPRSVHLTGYYSGSRHLNHIDSSESYGVDIAKSDSVHSVHGSDEDRYEDSFIDDDDPDVFSASPISSDTAGEEMSGKRKPKERKVSNKQLKTRYKSVVSEDESNSQMPNNQGNLVLESDDEDGAVISTLLRSRTAQTEEKSEKKLSKTGDTNIENGGSHLQNQDDSMHDKNIDDIDTKSEYKKKRKERSQKTPEGVLKSDGEDRALISTLLQSKTPQAKEKLDKEISKTDDNTLGNSGSHLQTQNNIIHDIDNLAVKPSKSKKKRKERAKETPEVYGEIQNIVLKDEKTLHLKEKTEEKEQVTGREEDKTFGDSLLMESKTTQAEEKLENEISKTGDKKVENGGSRLKTEDNNSIHGKKTGDIDYLAVKLSKSKKKKRKERTKDTPEAYSEIQNIVMKDEKTLHCKENTEVKGQITDREEEQTFDDSLPSTKFDKENDVRPKKKRRRSDGDNSVCQATMDSVPKQGKVNQNGGTQDSCKDISMENKDQKLRHDKNRDLASDPAGDEDRLKDKKSKKKIRTQEKEENGVIGVCQLSESDEKKNSGASDDNNVESKMSKARTFSNGLKIEDIDMGKPDGKVATWGKKIKIHYVGKLRDGGHVFDSNIGKSPLKFCLGAEGVTKGWNIGLDGMRVGGKRRLTIPPTNGDGSQGAGENVPLNSWLVYDFELVGVR